MPSSPCKSEDGGDKNLAAIFGAMRSSPPTGRVALAVWIWAMERGDGLEQRVSNTAQCLALGKPVKLLRTTIQLSIRRLPARQ